uniref:Uncharacterized protein n=1 Tax=Micrurus corallinus TaxID=54390 RepID=A0A2D4GZ99_MICCO
MYVLLIKKAMLLNRLITDNGHMNAFSKVWVYVLVVRILYCRLTAHSLEFDPEGLKINSAFHPSEVGKTRAQNVGERVLSRECCKYYGVVYKSSCYCYYVVICRP